MTDGDTIKLDGTSYRIWGIDAAETKQTLRRGWPAGRAATTYMRELVHGRSVVCEYKTKDRYGHTVALCRADGADLGAAMVRATGTLGPSSGTAGTTSLRNSRRAPKVSAFTPMTARQHGNGALSKSRGSSAGIRIAPASMQP